jgi:hypothetical protein
MLLARGFAGSRKTGRGLDESTFWPLSSRCWRGVNVVGWGGAACLRHDAGLYVLLGGRLWFSVISTLEVEIFSNRCS